MFISFCLSYSDLFYLLTEGVEGYCCIWPHSVTQTKTHKHTLTLGTTSTGQGIVPS